MTLTGQQTASYCVGHWREVAEHKARFLREGLEYTRNFVTAYGKFWRFWAVISDDAEYEAARQALHELKQKQ